METKTKTQLFIFILLVLDVVSASVSHPAPLKLSPGEKGKFTFAIDAALFSTDLQCKIEFESKTPLTVSFDALETKIGAGKRVFVKGEIKAPNNIETGTYQETFCVACNPLNVESGTTTKPRYCDIPLTISIEKTQKSLSIEKIQQPLNIVSQQWNILLIVLNISLIVTAIIIFKKRKRSIEF